jgi:hypothetical protein
MIFINKNIDPLTINFFVYALHAYTYLHKKFGIILIILNLLINLNVFKCLFHV